MTIAYNHEKIKDVTDWESVLKLFLTPNRARIGAKVVELLLKPENRSEGLSIAEIRDYFPANEIKTVERLIYQQGKAFRFGGESSKEHDLMRLGIITNRGTKMLKTGRWAYSDQFRSSLLNLSKKIKKLEKE